MPPSFRFSNVSVPGRVVCRAPAVHIEYHYFKLREAEMLAMNESNHARSMWLTIANVGVFLGFASWQVARRPAGPPGRPFDSLLLQVVLFSHQVTAPIFLNVLYCIGRGASAAKSLRVSVLCFNRPATHIFF